MNQTIAGEANITESKQVDLSFTQWEDADDNCAMLRMVVRYPDLRIFSLNAPAERFFGWRKTDLPFTERHLTNALTDDQAEMLLSQLNAVTRNRALCAHFYVYRLKQGEAEHSFFVYASPVSRKEDATDNYFHLTLTPNVSQWRMPCISFDTQEVFLEQFKGDNFGTFELLLGEKNIQWSEGVYNIFELNADDHALTNSFVKSFLHPDDMQRIIQSAKTAIEKREALDVEFKIITARRNLRTLHCLARVVESGNGSGIKLAGSVRDITEQRSIEESLKSKVEELNHSNKELEEFAYVASHDIQEPLRKITTFSDRLAEKYRDVLKGDGAMYLSRIIASADNMRRLINDLLEFSRISKTEQPFERTNLNYILKQVKNDLELIIEETGTTIIAEELPVIVAIPSQMKQLFTNIISNAVKFRKPDAHPEIRIESSLATTTDKLSFDLILNTPYYKIQITDNGIGFEEEYATRIFQVFQRLHGKSEYPGSGIGLAICKKIMERHLGVIYAENIPGAGARFVFILPQSPNV